MIPPTKLQVSFAISFQNLSTWRRLDGKLLLEGIRRDFSAPAFRRPVSTLTQTTPSFRGTCRYEHSRRNVTRNVELHVKTLSKSCRIRHPGCLVQISDSKASKAHLLTGLQPHPIKRQQICGGFNFGLTATKGLVFVLDGSFRGDRCRIERVSRK